MSAPGGLRAGDAHKSRASRLTLDNLGFLLAKASQRWNNLLYEQFVAAGFPEVRPAYGSLLIPLFEEDGLRQGELARRARLSKQTMTTMARALEREGLIKRRVDPTDARATLIFLTQRAQQLRPVAERVLAELDAHVARALSAAGGDSLKEALRQIATLDSARHAGLRPIDAKGPCTGEGVAAPSARARGARAGQAQPPPGSRRSR